MHLLFLFIIEEDVNIMGVIAAPNLTPILLFNIIQNKLIKSQTEQHNIFLRERRESHYELLLIISIRFYYIHSYLLGVVYELLLAIFICIIPKMSLNEFTRVQGISFIVYGNMLLCNWQCKAKGCSIFIRIIFSPYITFMCFDNIFTYIQSQASPSSRIRNTKL